MGFQVNTDFSGIEPNAGGMSYLPVSDSKGWQVIITDSKDQENGKKTGRVAVLDILGQEGAAQGKTTQMFVNLTNPEQKAVEIGLGELSAIAHATGHIRVGNSQEWHNKPFRVVVVSDASEKYPTATRIQRVLDINGNFPKPGGQQAMQPAGSFGGQPTQQQQPAQQQFVQQQPQQQQPTQQQPAQFGGVQHVQHFQPQGQGVQQPAQPNGGQPQFQPTQQQQPVQQQPQQQFVQQTQPAFDPNTGQPLNPQQFQQQPQQSGPGWNQ